MKSYTDLAQSKKLAEILPIESADMFYSYGMDIFTNEWGFDFTPTIIDEENPRDFDDVQCWSLAFLLQALPKINGLKPMIDLEENSIQYNGVDIYVTADNLVDACYELILRLHKQKML